MKFPPSLMTRGLDEAGDFVCRLSVLSTPLWRACQDIVVGASWQMEQVLLASQAARALRGLERSFAIPGLDERLKVHAAEERFAELQTDTDEHVQRIIASLRGDP